MHGYVFKTEFIPPVILKSISNRDSGMARKKELREIIYVTVVFTCIDYLTRSNLREDTFILVYDISR